MTDRPTTPAPTPEEPSRPKGGPMMIVLLVITVGPALLVGQLFGAGGAAIVGGFVAMFSLISTMGGSLRANLRRFALVGPLIAVGTIAPRLLAELWLPAGIALAVVVVFVAGLLPLRGRRYDATALGLGMGTLLGYSMPIGVASPLQLLAAAAAGLVVGLLLLALTGLKDPSGPTRAAVADLLEDDGGDFSTAFEAWTTDRSPRWLGAVMLAAGRYRLARRLASADAGSRHHVASEVEAAQARAAALAEKIRMKTPEITADPTSDERGRDEERADGEASSPALEAMRSALEDASQAVTDRDEARTPVPAAVRNRVSAGAVRAVFGAGSVQLRHAIRSTVAVVLAFVVSLFLEHGDPLLPTLLMTTFGIVQVSWSATLARARDRFIGIVVGGLIVLGLLLLLPAWLLFPVSMIGLAVGMWFITARPAVGTAGLIVMSVGLNSELRDLDPGAVAIEYVLLTLAALLIGGVIGFVIVPSWRPAAIGTRAHTAIDRTAKALLDIARSATTDTADTRLASVAASRSATAQLVPDHEKLSDEQQQQLERLRQTLSDLLITAIFQVTSSPAEKRTAISDAAALLMDDDVEPVDQSSPSDIDPLLLLAGQARMVGRQLS